jgi:hypothetical protein
MDPVEPRIVRFFKLLIILEGNEIEAEVLESTSSFHSLPAQETLAGAGEGCFRGLI